MAQAARGEFSAPPAREAARQLVALLDGKARLLMVGGGPHGSGRGGGGGSGAVAWLRRNGFSVLCADAQGNSDYCIVGAVYAQSTYGLWLQLPCTG